MLADNAADAGLEWRGGPAVERREVALPDGRAVSSIVWGADPQVVFLHGGGQNAHTWDTVVLAMGLDALAVDLPGHGHSRRDPASAAAIYDPVQLADDVAVAIRQLAPQAQLVAGMSLGGLTSIVLAARHPELVRRVAVVDVTPGVTLAKAATMGPAAGPAPESFATREEIVERTVGADPTRVPEVTRAGRDPQHPAAPERPLDLASRSPCTRRRGLRPRSRWRPGRAGGIASSCRARPTADPDSLPLPRALGGRVRPSRSRSSWSSAPGRGWSTRPTRRSWYVAGRPPRWSRSTTPATGSRATSRWSWRPR